MRKIIYTTALIVVVTGILISLIRSKSGNDKTPKSEESNEISLPEIVYKFDIPVDSFSIEEITIKKNEILSGILLSRGINYNQIDELARRSRPVFTVKKIKAGNSFTFF